MTKILKFLNDNHWQAIAVTAIIALGIWFYGCESKVPSLRDPTKHLTREELKIEVDNFLAQATYRYQQLDQQDEIRRLILEQAVLFGQTGTFSSLGALNLLVSIAAVGSALDSRRKLKSVTAQKFANIP